MDKLRHIDKLLKTSLAQYDGTEVLDNDWLAVEKKLKQRKNRIFAMWFSLALIALSGVGILYTMTNDQPTTTEVVNVDSSPDSNTNQDLTDSNNKTNSSNPLSSNTGSDDENGQTDINSTDASSGVDNDGINENPTTTPVVNPNPSTTSPSTTTPQDVVVQDKAQLDPVDRMAYIGLANLYKHDFLYNSEVTELTAKATIPNRLKLERHTAGFEVGMSFTPSSANKILSENAEYAGLINHNYYDIIGKSESSSFAYSSGLNFEYHFKNRLFIGSGIGFTQRAESVKYDYVITEYIGANTNRRQIESYQDRDPSQYVYINFNGSNSYHFIDVPLTIGYASDIGRNLQWRNQLDVSYMLLMSQVGQKTNYTYLTLDNLSDLNTFNQNNLAFTIKSGIYFNFKNFVIGGEPTFGYNATSITNKESAIQIKPYSYGLNITTNYRFNKK